MTRDEVGEELAAWGKVALLEVRGRRTGRPVRTAVGFVEEPDGSLLVAAGEPDADWALNLLELGTAIVTIGERTAAYAADELGGAEHDAAVTSLILRYGTPAEGLGRGPAFRLRPVPSVAG
ncbi:MAG: nitroreductase family deazaflavin-dependent oxidoreductase [Chloroflexi bacterium]|nr:nitroreductase family deazaflavin-dependent oxidoreductase [Chloroflexota bacterium]